MEDILAEIQSGLLSGIGAALQKVDLGELTLPLAVIRIQKLEKELERAQSTARIASNNAKTFREIMAKSTRCDECRWKRFHEAYKTNDEPGMKMYGEPPKTEGEER